MNIRYLLIPVLVLVLLGSPAFSGGQKEKATMEEKKVELSYWGWGTHVDAVNKDVGPAFAKLHPNVSVQAVAMGPWELMDKFYTSIVTGKGYPDCSILVRRVIAKYLIPELLFDFTDFLDQHKGDFPDGLVKDITSVDGKKLAIPPDYGPAVLYYYKELSDKLAIDVKQIKTWDDYFNLGLKFSKTGGDYYIHPVFYPGGSWGSNNWRFFAQSIGGNIYDDNGKVIKNNAKLMEATKFYYKLYTELKGVKGKVNDPYIYDTLRAGKLLFWPSNSYRSMEIAQQAPELEGKTYCEPWPLWGKDAPPLTGVWGGVALVVPRRGPNAETAAEFVKFYATNEEALTKLWFGTTGVPAFKPVREKIVQIKDRQTFSRNLMESIMAREVSPWNFTDWSQTEKILGDTLDAMIAGDIAPEKAWKQVEEQLAKILGR